jgi:hypothetical protein
MAKFRVGQRVKRVGHPDTVPLGAEGVIIALDTVAGFGETVYHRVQWGAPVHDWYHTQAKCLAPLTDPKAEQFIESLKNLKPYEEPLVEADVREREAEFDRAFH